VYWHNRRQASFSASAAVGTTDAPLQWAAGARGTQGQLGPRGIPQPPPTEEVPTILLSRCSRPMYSKFRETLFHPLDESHCCYFFLLKPWDIKHIFLRSSEISMLWMSTRSFHESYPLLQPLTEVASTTSWDSRLPSLVNGR